VSLARPGPLREGDRVVLVAPAGPVPEDQLRRGAEVLRSWGLRVDVAPHVLDRHPVLRHLAGADADRAADLQRAWCDPDVDAVMCVRGGYGSLRVLDLLDWSAMAAARPKVFTGSSDITALHAAFAATLGVATLFAPMTATGPFLDSTIAGEHLRLSLFEPERVRVLTRPSAVTVSPGVARGTTVGGNACLLADALGARTAPPHPADGSIALLEDVGEEPYRLDRILTRLLRAGWFDGVRGIALGSWDGCGEPSEVAEVLVDRLGGLGVPILGELGFGHCADQFTVPLGVDVELDADARTLTVLDRGR
jgi:muramoyltetrapeptide carboxypeptidase